MCPHHLRAAGDAAKDARSQRMPRPLRAAGTQRDAERSEPSRQTISAEQHEGHVAGRRMVREPWPGRGEARRGDRRNAVREIENDEAEPLGTEQDLRATKRFAFVVGSYPE